MTDLQTHLSRLNNPLHYAIRNDFANLPRLRELELFVRRQMEALRPLPLSDRVSALLTELTVSVAEFDSLTLAEKRIRVQEASRILSCLHELTGDDTVCQTSVAALPDEIPSASTPQYPRLTIAAGAVSARRRPPAGRIVRQAIPLQGRPFIVVLSQSLRRPPQPDTISHVTGGARQTFSGRVAAYQLHHTSPGKSLVSLRVEDSSALLIGNWFQHLGLAAHERFPIGARVVGTGIITFRPYGDYREVIRHDLEMLEKDDTELIHFNRLVPIYPLTAGLSQKNMRSLLHNTVRRFGPSIGETLPDSVRNTHRLPLLRQAMQEAHFPKAHADLGELNEQQTVYHERLSFEEFFLLEVGLAIRHREARTTQHEKHYHQPNHLGKTLQSHLPF